MALSPWHLFVSGNARCWSLVYFLSVVSAITLLRAIESDQRRDLLFALLPLVKYSTPDHPAERAWLRR